MRSATYLSEEIRSNIIKTYLLHEHRKLRMLDTNVHRQIIRYATDRLFRSGMDHVEDYIAAKDPGSYIDSLELLKRWELFHYVSYGLFFKELWLCVGHPKFEWTFNDRLPLSRCIFETRVGGWKDILHKKPTYDQVLQYAEQHKEDIFKMVEKEYIRSADGCEKDPVIGTISRRMVLVHDGNGRVLKKISKILRGQDRDDSISAFIGEPNRKPGREDLQAFTRLKKEVFLTKKFNFGYKTEELWYDRKNLVSDHR
ncbi:MAG: hypothetical protein JXA22_00150 [Candidatus Thermoplasmatota archaeon]|nr:hypothetical protein [Candidatus Thermoplasmatota archaeon]